MVKLSDFDAFVEGYYGRFVEVLRSFDKAPLRGVLEEIDGVIASEATLWIAGNGGSAAIANHAACDLTKGTHVQGRPVLRCQSLAANVSLLSALGNDIGYDEVFSRQLEYCLRPRDAVLLVSSSGNSPNVVKACEYANARGNPTIAFVGFAGGKLKEIARHCVWVPVESYGIVEDAHQSLVHVMTEYVRARSEQN